MPMLVAIYSSTKISNTSEHRSEERTNEVKTEKRVYNWTYTIESKSAQEVRLLKIKKKIYRRNITCGEVVVGHMDRYDYSYTIT